MCKTRQVTSGTKIVPETCIGVYTGCENWDLNCKLSFDVLLVILVCLLLERPIEKWLCIVIWSRHTMQYNHLNNCSSSIIILFIQCSSNSTLQLPSVNFTFGNSCISYAISCTLSLVLYPSYFVILHTYI